MAVHGIASLHLVFSPGLTEVYPGQSDPQNACGWLLLALLKPYVIADVTLAWRTPQFIFLD